MNISIINGRLIDPANGKDAVADLHISNDLVVGIDTSPHSFVADQLIDAEGLCVCPGLVDTQARLREPGEDHTGSMESELKAAVKGGITTVCVPPDTYPIIDTPAMVQMTRQRAESLGLAHVLPIGALTVGLKGERLTDMGSLHQAGCSTLSNSDRAIENTLVMRRAMQYATTFDLIISLNAQDPWLVGNGAVHEGEISTRLGLPVIPEAAETVGVARDLALVETTGIRAHFSCLSTAKAVAMIARAQQQGLPVTASVTAHHLHLCETDVGVFNTMCKVMPPLRSSNDRSALLKAVKQGVVSSICSDHQAHGRDAKLAPFSEAASGIAGLETLLGLSITLVDREIFDLPTAIASLTINPARAMGIERGSLGVGDQADVCVFDREKKWRLDPNSMLSRGSNTPFTDTELIGQVEYTIVSGNIVYSRAAS